MKLWQWRKVAKVIGKTSRHYPVTLLLTYKETTGNPRMIGKEMKYNATNNTNLS